MKKQTIKLTEAKLRDMIKKAVHESIYECNEDEFMKAMKMKIKSMKRKGKSINTAVTARTCQNQ